MVDVTTETHEERTERLGGIIKELSTFDHETQEDGTIITKCTMVAVGESHMAPSAQEGMERKGMRELIEKLMIERMALDFLVSEAKDFSIKKTP